MSEWEGSLQDRRKYVHVGCGKNIPVFYAPEDSPPTPTSTHQAVQYRLLHEIRHAYLSGRWHYVSAESVRGGARFRIVKNRMFLSKAYRDVFTAGPETGSPSHRLRSPQRLFIPTVQLQRVQRDQTPPQPTATSQSVPSKPGSHTPPRAIRRTTDHLASSPSAAANLSAQRSASESPRSSSPPA